jgi:hypothetical protein
MNKRGMIILLIGVNVLLLAAITFTVYTPPSAFAQAMGGRHGEYLLFSARAEVLNDAIYMLDAANHKLHVFRSAFPRNPATGATSVAYFSTRDLARDFAAAPGAVQPAPGAQPNQGAQP